MLKFNIVTDDGDASSVTVFPGSGSPLVATREHPNFTNIIKGITATGKTEEEIIGLFDIGIGLKTKFQKVSDRVSLREGKVYFDNMPTESVLTDAIIRFHLAGHDDFMSLVNFMEKIEQNPNPNSRENLFRWLKSAKFSITPDGDVIAYKRVNRAKGMSSEDECYQSTRSGPAIVDGEPVDNFVPNKPGVIVEMARNEVTFDPHVTCSQGLHVADWSYANDGPMSGTDTLMVLVNPRDVVSVPTDYGDKKMRVCRYKVLKKVTAEETEMLHVDRELQTLTAHTQTWTPPKGVIERSTTPRKAVKKAATSVKKAVKKATTKKAAKPEPKATVAKKVSAPIKAAEPKKAAPKKAVSTTIKPGTLPKYYEQFTTADFAKLPYAKLVWLAKQWEVKPLGKNAGDHAVALSKEAQVRLDKAVRKTSSSR